MQVVRTVPSPHRKLNALCAAAAPSGGTLTTFTAVAKAIDVSPGRITQLFGHGTEQEGSNVEWGTLQKLADAFTRDGVKCEAEWLCLDHGGFLVRLAKANPDVAASRGAAISDAPTAVWERTEETALPGLVELQNALRQPYRYPQRADLCEGR